MSAAGQQSERTPDFIPGWFAPRPGNPDTAEREAVRFIGTQDFPINFLRPSEGLHVPERPQLGVCIGPRGEDFWLAVPPGYWIVRDADGRPQNWRDEDFAEKWVRNNDREWVAPVERADDLQRQAEESGQVWPEGSPERRLIERGGKEAVLRDLRAAEGPPSMSERKSRGEERPAWWGEPPAEGTRRKLIGDVLRVEDVLSESEVREFADAIELALCDVEGATTDTTPEAAVLGHDRDDRWVSEVVYQAVGAGTRPMLEDNPEYVFPAERVRDAVAALLEEFGIPRACHDCQEEQLEHGFASVAPDEDRGDDAPTEESYEDRLLRQREEARAGESRFAEERDCAFALLRWLLPVTVAKRID